MNVACRHVESLDEHGALLGISPSFDVGDRLRHRITVVLVATAVSRQLGIGAELVLGRVLHIKRKGVGHTLSRAGVEMHDELGGVVNTSGPVGEPAPNLHPTHVAHVRQGQLAIDEGCDGVGDTREGDLGVAPGREEKGDVALELHRDRVVSAGILCALLDAGVRKPLQLPDLQRLGVTGRRVEDGRDSAGEIRQRVVSHGRPADPYAVRERRLGVANIGRLNHDRLPGLLVGGVDDIKGEDVIGRAISVPVDKELERGRGALSPFTVTARKVATPGGAKVGVVSEAVGTVSKSDGSRGRVSAVETRDGDDSGGVLEESVGRDSHGQCVVGAGPGRALADALGAEEGLMNLQGLSIALGRELAIAVAVGARRILPDSETHLGARGAAKHRVDILVHRKAIPAVPAEGALEGRGGVSAAQVRGDAA